MRSSILIIYTGGTIGMKTDAATGALVPFDFSGIYDEFPSLKRLNVDIDVRTLSPVIDSSNVAPANWVELAGIIRDSYARYDGFVVLHGTDTMSYTASAMSFMLENPSQARGLHRKPDPHRRAAHRRPREPHHGHRDRRSPQQRPSGRPRSVALLPEPALPRQPDLEAQRRGAQAPSVRSDNYPPLAEVGVNIAYNYPAILRPAEYAGELRIATRLAGGIEIIKALPGARPDDAARHALRARAARRGPRNLRRGKRPHLRMVHQRPWRRPSAAASSCSTSRSATAAGSPWSSTRPVCGSGAAASSRLRHDHRGRRNQTHVCPWTRTPARGDRTDAPQPAARRIYGLKHCTNEFFFLYFALLKDPNRPSIRGCGVPGGCKNIDNQQGRQAQGRSGVC